MVRKRSRLTLDDLPDCILPLILSKIPFKQAVHCSLVSKGWKFCWTFAKNLKFPEDFFSSSRSPTEIQNIIDLIFELHSGPLEVFEFNNVRFCCSSDKISDWIHRAALKGVQEIKIVEKVSEIYEVPTAIFLCQNLRSLALKNFLLTNLPDGFGGLADLTTLDLCNVDLNDKIVELMLELCPGLETLILSNCNGLERLKICSKSLIALSISSKIKAITASCPRLTSLTILLDNTETKLDLPACLSLCTNAGLESFTALRTLRRITFLNGLFWRDVKILKEFPDLEQMCVHKGQCSDTDFFQRDDDAILPLENLKWVHLNITYFHHPVPLLSCLFRIAPALKTLLISRKKGFNGVSAEEFINLAWNLQRPSTETKVFLSRCTAREKICVDCDLVNFI
ncbi:hypothetical protein SUGI_0353000 [Cryptomeria japonica]|uniref:F-box/FBD/LRR-repeat protein At1g13570-like n=1 Tax=Cryptomeria japonica TaxID=3369 RepID=UPI002408AAE9|nr:F-box/FBD/LRR-repeat protein At1g13570-like [Cryptomeria japonica]GLJ19545.1 hypothetical protein SUGI_0353000 [Cryptomeria japonica]